MAETRLDRELKWVGDAAEASEKAERARWVKRLREMEADLEKRSQNHPTEYWTAVAIIDMTRNYFPEIKDSPDAD